MALFQAFVSGFCVNGGRGMSGWPHQPWTSISLCEFGPIPSVCGHSLDGRSPFSIFF